MPRTTTLFGFLAAAAVLSTGARAARADRDGEHDGLGVSAGAGVQGFTGTHMRDTASPGGLVDVRIVVGTRSYIAFEAAYVGTLHPVSAPLGGQDASLVGTTFEGIARSNLLLGDLQPYGFIGGGWTHYTVTESFSMADSGMNDSDDVFTIPLGIGCSYRRSALLLDARATARIATAEGLVLPGAPDPLATQYATMHTLGFTASVGYEF